MQRGLKKREAHEKTFSVPLTFSLFIEMAIALSYILYLQFLFIDIRYFISTFSKETTTKCYETTLFNDMIEILVLLR